MFFQKKAHNAKQLVIQPREMQNSPKPVVTCTKKKTLETKVEIADIEAKKEGEKNVTVDSSATKSRKAKNKETKTSVENEEQCEHNQRSRESH